MSRLFEPRGVNVSSDVCASRGEGAEDAQRVCVGSAFDRPMAEAAAEGAKAHRRLLAGEITQREYERERAEICARHGI